MALVLVLSALPIGTALAAEPTAALVGNTSIVASPGDQGIQQFSIRIDVSGSVPRNPNNPPKIWVCDVDTLHADGSLSCDSQREITLVAGHNYTQSKTDSNGNTFPMDITKTINIDADVPYGLYNVVEVVTSQEGAGVSFAGDVHRVELPFTIEVVGCEEQPPQWCSPGYWKQEHHLGSWTATGISPSGLYSAYFGAPPPRSNQGVRSNAPTDPTLLQVVSNPQWYGGNAANNVADLLSNAHPDVNFTGVRVEDSCPLGRNPA